MIDISWDQLHQIVKEAKQAREQPPPKPTTCPNDGAVLVSNSKGVLGCTFCGWRDQWSAT